MTFPAVSVVKYLRITVKELSCIRIYLSVSNSLNLLYPELSPDAVGEIKVVRRVTIPGYECKRGVFGWL